MSRSKKTVSRKNRSARRLGVESLERRQMLSITLVGSELQVVGTDGADTAEVWTSSGRTYGKLNSSQASWTSSAVTSVRFSGGDGNDVFTNRTSLRTTAHGDAGADRLTGGTGGDSLYGDAGADFLDGGANSDSLYGGNGNDTLEGGDGNDTLRGEADNDTLAGEAGVDYLYGNTGNDTLSGGSSGDRLEGGDGTDALSGDTGSDWLYGGNGTDTITGGDDADWLFGDAGDDTLRGGNGNDDLYGADGRDQLFGDAGDDVLDGGDDDDRLNGGSGADEFHGGQGQDTLLSLDGVGTDSLHGDNDYDTFWTDLNDSLDGASENELAESIHRIASFENGADRTLDGDDIDDPLDGTDYKNFADRPLFASDGPSADDVDQGALGDCGLLAAMAGVAYSSRNAIYQTVVDLDDGTYAVRLEGDQYFRVDADLPTVSANSDTPIYANLGVADSLWVAIIEKAYTHYRGADTYDGIEGEAPEQALIALNAANTGDDWFATYASSQALLNDIATKFDNGLAVACGFSTVPPGSPLVGEHAYTVVGVNRDANGRVTSVILRNPWGPAGADANVTVTGDQLWDCSAFVAWGEVI